MLSPGTRLGSYEVIAALGAGGMGEVYRATDTKLKRQVAIKILPASLASDHDRLARFQREAEVLASLNHPNIAGIYGLEESGGVSALVMELVEGPTLADRIARGSGAPHGLPEAERVRARPRDHEGSVTTPGGGAPGGLEIDEAVAIAKQIAEALEAAHERGIIHRDLKPANIKVRPDGTVKVLDFGLAKALDPSSPGATAVDIANSPTITSPALTSMGMILGTAAYMSPEQARGKAVDKRADIWAFGCVLYEMLTGKRAFDAEDVSLTLAEVMKSEPDWSALPPLPPLVDVFLRQCLKKDPRQRIGDIHDVRLALEGAFEMPVPHVTNAAAVVPPLWRRPLPVAVGTALVSVLLAGVAVSSLWPVREPRIVRRFPITLPSSQTLPSSIGSLLSISADGRTLAYRAVEQGVMRFYLRAIGQLDSQAMPGTEVMSTTDALLLSPDNQWLWFWSDNTLMRVPLSGGRPVRVTDRNDPTATRGMSWAPDGTLIVGGRSAGLLRLPKGGSKLEALIAPDDGREYWYPQVLPQGRAVLFTASFNSTDAGDVMLFDLRTNTRRTLVRQAVAGWYAPTGHLVFLRAGDLWAIRFDAASMDVVGEPVPVEQGIRVEGGGAVQFAVAADGSLVYVPSGTKAPRTLVWVDRQGRETPIPAEPRPYSNPRLSPDGTRVAVAASDRDFDLWVLVLGQSGLTRVTSDVARDDSPIWTADGRRLIYFSAPTGPWNLFWHLADGTGAAERLTESPNQQWPAAVSRDGLLVFTEAGKKTRFDVMQLALDGTRRVTPLVQSEFAERNGVISPDGHWLAYDANDSGRAEIYVRPFPDVNAGRWRVSETGGSAPLWAQSGQELFYVSPTGAVMSVAMGRGPASATTATQVVKAGYFVRAPARPYDVTSDGQRFLMIKEADIDPAEPDIVLVENWFEELERLVPTK
jgi:serine/threonine-protein kinase